MIVIIIQEMPRGVLKGRGKSLALALSLYRCLSVAVLRSLGAIVLRWLHLLSEFTHHILVDNWIQIAAKHIDQPPVPDVQFPR